MIHGLAGAWMDKVHGARTSVPDSDILRIACWSLQLACAVMKVETARCISAPVGSRAAWKGCGRLRSWWKGLSAGSSEQQMHMHAHAPVLLDSMLVIIIRWMHLVLEEFAASLSAQWAGSA